MPGDVVVFEGGGVISADLRLLDGSEVEAYESALTGESAPVSKRPEPLGEEAVLGDRANILHKGTAITRGAILNRLVLGPALRPLRRRYF